MKYKKCDWCNSYFDFNQWLICPNCSNTHLKHKLMKTFEVIKEIMNSGTADSSKIKIEALQAININLINGCKSHASLNQFGEISANLEHMKTISNLTIKLIKT